MEEIKLGAVETRFAELIWDNEPLPSGQLVRLCERELNWKKPTTYNVLKKLCGKGLFRNSGGVVSAVMSRDDFRLARGERLVEESYGGSLPAFIAAFTARNPLSKEEVDEIQKMIDDARKEV